MKLRPLAALLEGRYQYEDARTGSAWLGWTFEMGDKVQFAVTPMVGGAFGRTNGVAPGLEMSLTWQDLELSSSAELIVYGFNLYDSDARYAILGLGLSF